MKEISSVPQSLHPDISQRHGVYPESFSDLPGEIRQRIYQYVFEDTLVKLRLPLGDNRDIPGPRHILHKPENCLPYRLSLLVVNRQVHLECRELIARYFVGRLQTYREVGGYSEHFLTSVDEIEVARILVSSWNIQDFMDSEIASRITHLAMGFHDTRDPLASRLKSFNIMARLPCIKV